MATRDIRKGEQVLTNYGAGYFKHRGLEPLDLSTLQALPFERLGAN